VSTVAASARNKRVALVGSHLLIAALGTVAGAYMLRGPLRAAEFVLPIEVWSMVRLQHSHAPAASATKRVLEQYIGRIERSSLDTSRVADGSNLMQALVALSCVEAELGNVKASRRVLDRAESVCATIKKGDGQPFFSDCRLRKPLCCGKPTCADSGGLDVREP
jgi:hypothetical protein